MKYAHLPEHDFKKGYTQGSADMKAAVIETVDTFINQYGDLSNRNGALAIMAKMKQKIQSLHSDSSEGR